MSAPWEPQVPFVLHVEGSVPASFFDAHSASELNNAGLETIAEAIGLAATGLDVRLNFASPVIRRRYNEPVVSYHGRDRAGQPMPTVTRAGAVSGLSERGVPEHKVTRLYNTIGRAVLSRGTEPFNQRTHHPVTHYTVIEPDDDNDLRLVGLRADMLSTLSTQLKKQRIQVEGLGERGIALVGALAKIVVALPGNDTP